MEEVRCNLLLPVDALGALGAVAALGALHPAGSQKSAVHVGRVLRAGQARLRPGGRLQGTLEGLAMGRDVDAALGYVPGAPLGEEERQQPQVEPRPEVADGVHVVYVLEAHASVLEWKAAREGKIGVLLDVERDGVILRVQLLRPKVARGADRSQTERGEHHHHERHGQEGVGLPQLLLQELLDVLLLHGRDILRMPLGEQLRRLRRPRVPGGRLRVAAGGLLGREGRGPLACAVGVCVVALLLDRRRVRLPVAQRHQAWAARARRVALAQHALHVRQL
mmetsp:Transcript_25933/g.74033  ORF Transcript_25933/g.74033 Transcript_25933/m.74033 type:complete len:279 (-) Transcript_25933:181-1017(-)